MKSGGSGTGGSARGQLNQSLRGNARYSQACLPHWSSSRPTTLSVLGDFGAECSAQSDNASLAYFTVPDLPAALQRVQDLGGSVIHPGERWAVCRDSEGSPFALAADSGSMP
jgi:hypothetical protein